MHAFFGFNGTTVGAYVKSNHARLLSYLSDTFTDTAGVCVCVAGISY